MMEAPACGSEESESFNLNPKRMLGSSAVKDWAIEFQTLPNSGTFDATVLEFVAPSSTTISAAIAEPAKGPKPAHSTLARTRALKVRCILVIDLQARSSAIKRDQARSRCRSGDRDSSRPWRCCARKRPSGRRY